MDTILAYISGIDPSVKTLSSSVYIIWWSVLLLVVIVIVPLAIGLLHRTMKASISIRRYLEEMLEAGVNIADNTSSTPALKDTISVGGAMLGTADKLDEHTQTIAEVLSQRAKGGAS